MGTAPKDRDCRIVTLGLSLSALALLGMAAVASRMRGVPLALFTRDPMEITGGHPLYGVISNLGVLLWCSCAAVCFFTALALRGTGRRSPALPFILWGGMATTVLLLDDLFLLHDILLPRHLGMRQRWIYAGYAGVCLLYLLRFRAITSRNTPLLLAIALFGVSVVVDILPESVLPFNRHLVEDGSKFLGIALWCACYVGACLGEVRAAVQAETPTTPIGGSGPLGRRGRKWGKGRRH